MNFSKGNVPLASSIVSKNDCMAMHNTGLYHGKIFRNNSKIILDNNAYNIIIKTIKVSLSISEGLITLQSGRNCVYSEGYCSEDTESFAWEIQNVLSSLMNLNETVIYKEFSESNTSRIVIVITRNDKIFILANVDNIVLIESDGKFPIYLDNLRKKIIQDYINNMCEKVHTEAKIKQIHQIVIFVLIINLFFVIYLIFASLRCSKLVSNYLYRKNHYITQFTKNKGAEFRKEEDTESYYTYVDINKNQPHE